MTSTTIDLEFQLSFYIQWRSFLASLRNECPVGSGHSASPASEQAPCCCLAVFTWAKQMVVSSYLCSYTPPVQKAPFFSWRRLANDYGERCVTLMTPVAPQPTVGQELILKTQTESVKSAGSRTSVIGSAHTHTHIPVHILNYCNGEIFQIRQILIFYLREVEAGWYKCLGPAQTWVCQCKLQC